MEPSRWMPSYLCPYVSFPGSPPGPQPFYGPRRRPSLSKIPNPDPSVVTQKIYHAITSGTASSYADVTLISSDGTRIPAIRMILVISSPYFRKLLTSEFRESSLSEVSVSVASTALRQILEFIYTDDCALIREVRDKAKSSGIAPSPTSTVVHCNEVRSLIELADAADYTGVERLVMTCEQTVLTVMRRFPHIACTALQVLTKRTPSWCDDLLAAARRFIRIEVEIALLRNYDGCDVTCGVMHLDEKAAEEVFSFVKHQISGQTKMFQVLIAWVSAGTALQQSTSKRVRDFGPIIVDVGKMKVAQDRLPTAKRIATWFDFKQFKPKFLSDVVEKSSLLEPSAVSEAYRTVSLQYEGIINKLDEKVCSYEHENAELRARLFQDEW